MVTKFLEYKKDYYYYELICEEYGEVGMYSWEIDSIDSIRN